MSFAPPPFLALGLLLGVLDHAIAEVCGLRVIFFAALSQVIGTLNCLHEAGPYTPERAAHAQTLKQSGALALLVANAIHKGV